MLTCAGYDGGDFICIISSNPFKNSMRFLFLFLRWEYWDSEKLKARSKITHLVTEQNLNPRCLALELKQVTSILHCLQETPSSAGHFRAEPRLGLRRTVSLDKLIDAPYMPSLEPNSHWRHVVSPVPGCKSQEERKDEMQPSKTRKMRHGVSTLQAQW